METVTFVTKILPCSKLESKGAANRLYKYVIFYEGYPIQQSLPHTTPEAARIASTKALQALEAEVAALQPPFYEQVLDQIEREFKQTA